MEILHSDLIRGYKHIKRIINMLIRTNNIRYKASSIAPNTYKAMVTTYEALDCYIVFNGGDHGFLGQADNIRFRALHDAMHRENQLTFKFEDEKKLSDITKEIFMEIAWSTLNLTQWEVYVIGEIINAEIKGQIEYYEENGKYVEDQKQFITEYLEVA